MAFCVYFDFPHQVEIYSGAYKLVCCIRTSFGLMLVCLLYIALMQLIGACTIRLNHSYYWICMLQEFNTISPIDGNVFVRRHCCTGSEIQSALEKSVYAQRKWKAVPIAERCRLVERAVVGMVASRGGIAEEITRQIGRPLRYSPSEVTAFEDRALHFISIARASLADVELPVIDGLQRVMRREPYGVVFVVTPWSFPLLCCVNSLIPALLSGNSVLLRHSSQTPLVSERLVDAFHEAGLPEGVVQFLHSSHQDTLDIMRAPEVAYVCFSGNSKTGLMVQEVLMGSSAGLSIGLNGVDPAYVRADADLAVAVDAVVGAFYNSGQSCSGVQRVYVHTSVYKEFIERALAAANQYVLGNPLDQKTTLGPLARLGSAQSVRGMIGEALGLGAYPLVNLQNFPLDRDGSAYMAPQILTNVNHGMRIMQEECFGPVFGVMPVASDDEAIQLMNDSRFGLCASVFSHDTAKALEIGSRVQTGTWLMNRCDYLDPDLTWAGIKGSGRGVSAVGLGFAQLTHGKSYHLRKNA